MVLHKEGPSMNGKENLVLLLTRGRQRVRRGGAVAGELAVKRSTLLGP